MIKLKDLVFDDQLLSLRKPDEHVISRYRQCYRAGDEFPLPVVERGTKRIVSGTLRVMAMLREYGPDHKIKVQYKSFKTRADLLEFFVQENLTHGRHLTGYSRRALADALLKEGRERPQVAALFRVDEYTLETWGEIQVLVRGKGFAPVKRGPDIVKRTLDEEQVEEHTQYDLGIPVRNMAEHITRWARHGYLDQISDKDREVLRDMVEALDGII